MLLGLAPLLLIAVVLLTLLLFRLGDARSTLDAATGRADGIVTTSGAGSDGRELQVRFTDEAGVERTGTLTLYRAEQIPLGARIAVRYDPADPSRVITPGDAPSTRVSTLVTGLVLIGLATLACLIATLVRITRRRALAGKPPHPVTVRPHRIRRGLVDRSWLQLSSLGGAAWVPVYWEPVLATLGADFTAATAHGDPLTGGLVSVDVDGMVLWPSGRRRGGPPKGVDRPAEADTGDRTMAQQARADAVLILMAPILGLLWAYFDESGAAGFAVASVFCAGLLFWVPSTYGSDPT